MSTRLKLQRKNTAIRTRLWRLRKREATHGDTGIPVPASGLAAALARSPGNECSMTLQTMEKDRNQTVQEINNTGLGSGTTRKRHSYGHVASEGALVKLGPTAITRGKQGGIRIDERCLAASIFHYSTNNVSFATAARGLAGTIALKAQEVSILATPLGKNQTRRKLSSGAADERPVNFAGAMAVSTLSEGLQPFMLSIDKYLWLI